MSIIPKLTTFDLHCAQAIAEYQALEQERVQRETRLATKEANARKKRVKLSNGVGISHHATTRTPMRVPVNDESYNTTMMEIEPVPDRPALRVLNLLGRMGPPTTPVQFPQPLSTCSRHYGHSLVTNSQPPKGTTLVFGDLRDAKAPSAVKRRHDGTEEGSLSKREGKPRHLSLTSTGAFSSKHFHPYRKPGNPTLSRGSNEKVLVHLALV
ncbi:hypothetical protein FRB90_002665 [Tulasnella sp. 427]|nr:hypothetical protein FRB90_002665 [Tulasnella sp. 427]